MLATQCIASHCWIFSVSPPCWYFRSLSLDFLDITLLGLRTDPELSLMSSNPSICTSLLSSRFDALLFMQLSILHLLLFHHGIPGCLWVLFAFCLPWDSHHLRPHWLTSGFHNMNKFHRRASLCDHLAQIGHSCVKILLYFSGWAQTKLTMALNSVLLMPWRKWLTLVPLSIPL